ncbi:MAG: hypothetical protein M1826_002037 [Phylliscum demangeonii]|nr:MAG: hypothetical protein M1826_002037 [Phylliscum demangeonii]
MTITLDTGSRASAPRGKAALCLDDRFEILKDDIGDGSFGSVALARVRAAGANVARRGTLVAIKTMKKTFESLAPCLELREVIFLRTLPTHAHLVPALDIFLDPYTKRLHICMEHMHGNLYQLMKARNHDYLDTVTIKSILYQILSGLEHIHAHSFFHRDIKPENILVSTTAPQDPLATATTATRPYAIPPTPPPTPPVYLVKIADFGLARETHAKAPYTTYVSTRWYRAPEVLLRAGAYAAPVDIWAVGAMAVEIATLKPLFPGSNEVDQVWRVCEIMGSPGNWYGRGGGKIGGGEWPEGVRLAQKLGFSFPKMAPHAMGSVLPSPTWPVALADLVADCLRWDPKNRPTSSQALRHDFFDDAIDPLRPTSSASRRLGRKMSDLPRKGREPAESARTLTAKPSSWFRRSLIGRDATGLASPPAREPSPASPRPAPVHATTTGARPTAAAAASNGRPEMEKRSTWTHGVAASHGAPMPILPTIRPVSPMSDAVTAEGSATRLLHLRADEKRRRSVLDEKAAPKLGRQLSVASRGDLYADLHRQEAERALNGHGGLVSPPSAHRESFFSHLRKRARRLSGRNQAAGPDEVAGNAGCGPWSSNRSSMAVDALPAPVPTTDPMEAREPEKTTTPAFRYSIDLTSPASRGMPHKGQGLVESRSSKSLYPLGQEHALRTMDNASAASLAAGPVSSRTRRALQRQSHVVPRYDAPDEQEELLDEVMHAAQRVAKRLERNASLCELGPTTTTTTTNDPPRDPHRGNAGARHPPLRHARRDVAAGRPSPNPYPSPAPSTQHENVYFDQLEGGRSRITPLEFQKTPSYHGGLSSQWPTPPSEGHEWGSATTARIIHAAGATHRQPL